VSEELPRQQVLGGNQDPALGIEPFDFQADRMPMHPVGQPVGAGDDEGTAGTAGEDFAFLHQELDVFRRLNGQQGRGVVRDAHLGVHGGLLTARATRRAAHLRVRCVRAAGRWIEGQIVDSRQGFAVGWRRHQTVGVMPFLDDLFQPYRIFIIQASDDAVGDEDRQQAQDILDSGHDDSLKGEGLRVGDQPEKWETASGEEVALHCHPLDLLVDPLGFLASRASTHAGLWTTASHTQSG
jgi:hypothetical protein